MTQEIKLSEPGTRVSDSVQAVGSVSRGTTYVSLDPEFRGEVTVTSVSGSRVYYSGDAEGDATVEEFLKSYAPLSIETMTVEQLSARAELLSSEMDANDEENRCYQREIERIYARIDSMKS